MSLLNCLVPGVVTAISKRSDGDMKVAGPMTLGVLKNRKAFLNKIGIDLKAVVCAGIAHSSNVYRVGYKYCGQVIHGVDGLVTRESGIFLSITAADCLPIFFADKAGKSIGIAHAGWRGISSGIVEAMLNEMVSCGSNAGDIIISVGPHISKDFFEVKADVAEKFSGVPGSIDEKDGKLYVDLGAVVRVRAKIKGVDPKNIYISNKCTYRLKEEYFSFRRDKPKNIQAMIAVIGKVEF